MADDDLPKYSLIDCQVTGHQSYGLVVRSSSGQDGFIDRADISDEPSSMDDWPAIGDSLWGVVLGYTRDGRVRLSARQRDVALVSSVSDPAHAFEIWKSLKDAEPDDHMAIQAFLAYPDARSLLRWAARHPAGTPEHAQAAQVLVVAPEEMQIEVLREDDE